ncbi:MAG: hypothetical protein COA96_15610 [SAR86 cluster bacterium]|uniref:Uncharacterized protein n=1 Tax=SAR86 cluster bacterium TaxID=2030880 RepID=A0A2A5ANM0_9GAMM|nr:MAG: hypothetical protein COA96_15610 [SAR86 cluster bacterium]
MVDLTTPTTSLRFPENNNETSVSGYRGFLQQPETGCPDFLAADGAAFAIIRYPKSRRVNNRNYGIYGTATTSPRSHYLSFRSEDFNSGDRGTFRFYLRGSTGGTVDLDSALWTEDSALVVMTRDTDTYVIDWYSLEDGTKFAGSVSGTITTNGTAGWVGDWLIGGTGITTTVTDIAPTGGYWPGEIQALCHVPISVSDATWQSIALGADIVTTLGATNFTFHREIDPITGLFSKNAACVNDTSSACVYIDGANLAPGSDFRRQDTTNYLTFDAFPTGYVHGLQAGDVSKSVTFSGTAGGYTGNVEVRLVYENTGVVHTDWAVVGAISGGTWSGSISINKSSNGWVFAQVRPASTPAAITNCREPFGIGWKFAFFGQSQGGILMTSTARTDLVDDVNVHRVSLGLYRNLFATSTTANMERVGLRTDEDALFGDGVTAIVQQLALYDDDTPICIMSHTENGTGVEALMEDADSNRDWTDADVMIALAGSDVTAIVWNWGTNDLGQGVNYDELLDAVIDGTPAQSFVIDNYFNDGTFDTGFGFVMSPLTRAKSTSTGPFDESQSGSYETVRKAQIDWAILNDHTIGPNVNMQLGTAEGPHQDGDVARGNPLFGQMIAIGMARHVSLDTTTNPSLQGDAYINSAGTIITIPVTLPNGGTLTATATSAITGFEVQDGGSGSFSRSGFTAVISGSNVVLTKSSTSWAAGTVVDYQSGGPMSYGTAGPSETTLLDGVLYETGLTYGDLPIEPQTAMITEVVLAALKNTGNTLEAGPDFVAADLPVNSKIDVTNERTDSASPTALDTTKTFTITVTSYALLTFDFSTEFNSQFISLI